MPDKNAKINSDQRPAPSKKAKQKNKVSRRHPEQRQAEREEDQAHDEQVLRQDAARSPRLPPGDHKMQKKSDADDAAVETHKKGSFPVVCIGALTTVLEETG